MAVDLALVASRDISIGLIEPWSDMTTSRAFLIFVQIAGVKRSIPRDTRSLNKGGVKGILDPVKFGEGINWGILNPIPDVPVAIKRIELKLESMAVELNLPAIATIVYIETIQRTGAKSLLNQPFMEELPGKDPPSK